MPTSFTKDPAAVLPYRWDWSAWLEDGDTITAATLSVPAGITKQAETHDTTTATVWLSGGTAGTSYVVGCLIETADGLTDERSIRISVRQR